MHGFSYINANSIRQLQIVASYIDVRLRDDSCVQIVSQLLKLFLSSSATDVVPFPDDEFQVLI